MLRDMIFSTIGGWGCFYLVLLNEDNLNRMQRDFRRNHVNRMSAGNCSPETGLIFIDYVDNMEKAGDHLTNIAQSVMGGLQWSEMEIKRVSAAD